jgi:hypothetical protein
MRESPDVDRVDLAQERQRLVRAKLAGPGHERPDVLGQATAAEPDAGIEKLATNPVVMADGVGKEHDIGPSRVADLGHGVDERDLGGQEGVGRHLEPSRVQ